MKKKLFTLLFALVAVFGAQAQECTIDGHEYVDLGLPSGTLWATCNVGATKPEGYGNYFAWGETKPKSLYNDMTYSYFSGLDTDDDGFIDWNFSIINIDFEIAGTKYDAATANWGAPWQMPSIEQFQELLNYCSHEWTTQNNVSGRKFTGPSFNSIFLPAAGYHWNDERNNTGIEGNYWCCEGVTSPSYFVGGAGYLGFQLSEAYWGIIKYSYGLNIRPVVAENAIPDGIGVVSRETINRNREGWYSLDGKKLNGEPTKKGIYIRNGRKVVK